MSQIPNEMQEPSMDELLASIREIIEENATDATKKEELRAVSRYGDCSSDVDVVQCDAPPNVIATELMHKPENVSVVENNLPVQDAMDALAERIGLRKSLTSPNSLSKIGDGTLLSSSLAEKNKEQKEVRMISSVVKSQVQKNKEKIKGEEEIGKPISADVERSVELILRPYIAQWLDDHFRQLFEKILLEEVQRVVQSLQR